MRTDVKVFLICLAVVVIFLGAYYFVVHHEKSSRRVTAENVLPSQQPALTPTTLSPNSTLTTQAATANDGDNLAGNLNVPASSDTVPPANAGPTTAQAGLGAAVPVTTMQGQIQPGGEISMNPSGGTTPASADGTGGVNQNGNGGTSTLDQGNAAGGNNSDGGSTGLAGLNANAATSGGHHAHTYVIRHGDTLVVISQRIFGNARMVRAIERANPGMDPRRLRVGQKITLPRAHGGTRHGISSGVARHAHGQGHHRMVRRTGRFHGGGRIYVVRHGDTLIKIARREYHRAGDWKLIYRANRRLIGARPGNIRIGERLVIPSR